MPLRVSTGDVISEQLCACPKEVPRIGLIISRSIAGAG
jgi:hypothetical protein